MTAHIRPPLLNQASVAHVRDNSDSWFVHRHRNDASVVRLMLADMAREGYEAYLPQLLRRKQPMRGGVRSTTLEWVSEPLFPGYVFVRRQEGLTPVRPVVSLYGVEGRDAVGKVRAVAVEAIRAQEQTIDDMTGWVPEKWRRYVSPEEWRAALKPGAAVEFEACGTFIKAVVTANDGEGRLRALMDLFGRSTAITIDLPVRVRAVSA